MNRCKHSAFDSASTPASSAVTTVSVCQHVLLFTSIQQATGRAGIPGYMYKRGPDLQSLQFYRSVEAVHIAHTQDTSSFFFLTEADKAEMQRLATSPDIGQHTAHCHSFGF